MNLCSCAAPAPLGCHHWLGSVAAVIGERYFFLRFKLILSDRSDEIRSNLDGLFGHLCNAFTSKFYYGFFKSIWFEVLATITSMTRFIRNLVFAQTVCVSVAIKNCWRNAMNQKSSRCQSRDERLVAMAEKKRIAINGNPMSLIYFPIEKLSHHFQHSACSFFLFFLQTRPR